MDTFQYGTLIVAYGEDYIVYPILYVNNNLPDKHYDTTPTFSIKMFKNCEDAKIYGKEIRDAKVVENNN